MSHKNKSKKHVYLGITLGLALALITGITVSSSSLKGSVTPTTTDNCQMPKVTNSQKQNHLVALDVNNDGIVTEADANIIFDKLNGGGLMKVRFLKRGAPYFDTNGDGTVSPIDALLVINYMKNCTNKTNELSTMNPQSIWYNQENRADVNGDKIISPIDLLMAINHYNNKGFGELSEDTDSTLEKIDANNDGKFSPIDINIISTAVNSETL